MTHDLARYPRRPAPATTRRIVPSRFPPVAAFEDAASADDLDAVLELEGWTNDRLVAARLSRLDPSLRVYGRPNASVVMAAFLHGSPQGGRFSSPVLGAWYAATELMTAVLEIANGLRKEMALSGLAQKRETFREYTARLGGDFVDIFGLHPEFHDPDDRSYPAAQAFGEQVRQSGPGAGLAGIRYESVRHPGHESWVCFVPPMVQDVVQARHFDIDLRPTGKVTVEQVG
ncbi:MAG: RES family NAD+ phosphorylase [Rubellimicrobium sp.]|nr:RES family NAD+ phosphorylase [Rubellimicrobium sp.]